MNSKNAILTTLLLFFITLEMLIALDFVAKQKDMRQQRAAIYTGLIELQNQLGYAGLIHNFKNAILRPDDISYRDKAIENYRLANIALNKLQLVDFSIVGELKMPATRTMLTAYHDRLLLLPELLDSNISARQVDNNLHYDNTAAHAEIEQVSQQLSVLLESKITDLIDRSFKLGLIILIALLLTLVAIVRFFFKEQQQELNRSNALNLEMELHRNDMARSQTILLSMMQDVEKEKHQASSLNEQLINKNKEMEQFIYTVSHDLKSPLVTIAAFSQKLKMELGDKLTEKQAHRLNRIMQNVDNMELLLTDLLDLSRIVQQAIKLTDINVKAIVEQQCDTLEVAIREAGVTINIAEDLHTVNANARLLSEGLLNLLSNAIRYREPSRLLHIDIFTTQSKLATAIHVKDNGIGIDPKYHELIFGIFEKLSATEGTGVGLTIVKTIMEKHNGQVFIDSQLGEGCCFTLEFPNAVENENKITH